MNIAYVCADRGVPVFGSKGCSLHVQEVIRALRRRGDRVTLFAAALDGPPPADLADLPVQRLPRARHADRRRRERADLAANDNVMRRIERLGPFEMVYERYSLWSHAGMEYARAHGIPGLLEVNAPLVEEQARYRGLVDREAALDVARRAFRAASRLIAVSRGVADYLGRFEEARGKIRVVPNGVSPERFPEPPERDTSAAFTLGFLGTLKPWHGVETLLDAFVTLHREQPRLRLLVVGDGPCAEQLRDGARKAGLEQAVQLTGAVGTDQVPALLARMDAGIAPYPPADGFYFSPLKIYEYMAAGLPVVASRIGDIPDIVEHGHTGLLYPPGDSAALVEALRRLIRDPAGARRMGRAGRAIALREYSWQARVEAMFTGLRPRMTPHCRGTG